MVIKHIHYQTNDKKEEYYYSRPSGIDEYVLILAHTPAFFHSNGKKYLLGKYQLFIYDKGQPQLMYASDGDFVHDWFHFDMTDTEREAFNKLGIPFGEPILVDEPSVLSEYIRMMAIEFNSGGAHSEEIIVNLMRSFFFKLSDQIRS